MDLKTMPKVDLHCHLDGSLDPEHVSELYGRKVERKELQIEENCQSLAEYLEKFEIPLQCLQTEENLEAAAYYFIRQAANDHVVYIEVRFAPMLHLEQGLTPEQVVEAVIRGLEKGGKEYGVMYQVILCMMRHHDEKTNRAVLSLAEQYLGKGVCALDLAGNEAAFPMELFEEIFTEAAKRNIPFTIHAGECGNGENVRKAVACGAARIGHGIAIRGSRELKDLCREKGVVLEVCPVSNIQTKSVKSVEEYPIQELIDDGVKTAVCTDNRTVSGTTILNEIRYLQKNWKITDEAIWNMMQNAAEAAFATKEQKNKLKEIFDL